MITIKRNCSSSIHDNPIKNSLTFGDFTIRFEGCDYEVFDWLKNELKAKSEDVLQEVMLAGIIKLAKDYGWLE